MRRSPLIASLIAFAAFAGPVFAEPPAGAPAAPPLGGPPVGAGAKDGKESFGDSGMRGKDGFAGRVAERRNMDLWKRAMEATVATLPPEGQANIKQMRADFETKMKAWRDQHGEEIRRLEQRVKDSMGTGDGDGKKAGRPDPDLVRQMQELRATQPKVEDLQQQIWSALTPDQQAAFKAKYDELQKEAAAKKDARKDAKDAKDAKDPKKAPAPGERDPMLPGGETPGKRPSNDKPFNFDDPPPPAGTSPNGDGKPSGK